MRRPTGHDRAGNVERAATTGTEPVASVDRSRAARAQQGRIQHRHHCQIIAGWRSSKRITPTVAQAQIPKVPDWSTQAICTSATSRAFAWSSGEWRSVGSFHHGLDPQGAAFLEILLGAGVLVADVDGDINAAGDDPGSKDAGRRRQNPPAEDQLDLFGAAEVEVVGDQSFEERPGRCGAGRTRSCGTPRSAASTAPTNIPVPDRLWSTATAAVPASGRRIPESGPDTTGRRSPATTPDQHSPRSRWRGRSSRSRPGWLGVWPAHGRSATP